MSNQENKTVECKMSRLVLMNAQNFLCTLATLITCTRLKEYIVVAQKLIDVHLNLNKYNYALNFFSCQKNNQNVSINSFVHEFNDLVIRLHIEAKGENIFLPISPLNFTNETCCVNCNETHMSTVDNSLYCETCGSVRRHHLAIAWSDVSRVHAAPTYMYDRKVQFKEWLLQYQGKCNVDLDLLTRMRYPSTRISKLDFLALLKQVTKQRTSLEQVHALYYHVYKIHPPDLSRIENDLLQDFAKFNKRYEKIGTTHVSHQFLLYQFLNRYGCATSTDDVLIPREVFAQKLPPECVRIFEHYEWPIYN